MKKQFTFIESMIKVGVIGFGGGNALIPVLEQEVVNEKKLVSKDEYDKSVIAATLTPGAQIQFFLFPFFMFLGLVNV